MQHLCPKTLKNFGTYIPMFFAFFLVRVILNKVYYNSNEEKCKKHIKNINITPPLTLEY